MPTKQLTALIIGLLIIGQAGVSRNPPDQLANLREAMAVAVRDLDVPPDVRYCLADRLDLIVPVRNDPARFRRLNCQLAAALPEPLRNRWLARALSLATQRDARKQWTTIQTLYDHENDSDLAWKVTDVCLAVYNLTTDVRLRASALAFLNRSRLAAEARYLSVLSKQLDRARVVNFARAPDAWSGSSSDYWRD
jgi:hypothetical protein